MSGYGGSHDVEASWERTMAGGEQRQEKWNETAGEGAWPVGH